MMFFRRKDGDDTSEVLELLLDAGAENETVRVYSGGTVTLCLAAAEKARILRSQAIPVNAHPRASNV